MSRPRIGLVTAWLSSRNGGVWEAVVAQVAAVRAMGADPVVIGLADGAQPLDRLGGAEVIACASSGPARLGFAPAMIAALRDARLDLLHLHGIWTYPSHAAAAWARASGRPCLISPHGMLDPWILARGRGRKRVARWLFEGRSWRRATAFHALTEAEARDIRIATGRSRTVVVPNAVDAAPRTGARPPVVLYLGRIHPKKNLPALIDGWALASPALRPAGAQLVIAGWGEAAHVAALENRIARYPGDDVHFVGPCFGEAKRQRLGEARFVALPSLSEGLPMAVLEAWAHGTPTLMSPACNLPVGFAAGAAIDCGTTPATIATALKRAFALPPAEWQAMADAAAGLAAHDFATATIGRRWDDIYRALLEGRLLGTLA